MKYKVISHLSVMPSAIAALVGLALLLTLGFTELASATGTTNNMKSKQNNVYSTPYSR